MYYISRFVQNVGLHHGRSLEDCIYFERVLSGKSNYCVLLIALFPTFFTPRLFFNLCIYIANMFLYFTSVNKRKYEKSIGSAVRFYCIQHID